MNRIFGLLDDDRIRHEAGVFGVAASQFVYWASKRPDQCGHLCGQDLKRKQAGRLASRVPNQIGDGHQSQDSEGARHHHSACCPSSRRRGHRMRRREFITLIGGAAAAWPLTARAQQAGKVWRIGVVTGEDLERRGRALQEYLSQLGYSPDTDFTISLGTVVPSSKNYEDAIARLLPDIDILVVWSTLGTVAARKVGVTLPTVFLSVGAPVNVGVVEKSGAAWWKYDWCDF